MSKLDDISAGIREKNLAQNINYKVGKQYDSTNSRALSDGDDRGKDDAGSGTVGSSKDIAERNKQTASAVYKVGNEYGIGDNI